MRPDVDALLARRRAAPADGLLSRLAHAEVDGARLTDDEILAFFQLLLLAGTETKSGLVANAVVCLLDYPAQFARVRAAPELVPGAIEEVLRYRTPVQMAFRATTRDVAIGGRTIPAGRLVLLMIGAANRDLRRFREAARFDVARDGPPHVAFGHGPHFCLGAALARLEARVALGELLDRAPSLARDGPRARRPRTGLNVHGPRALPVRLDGTR